MGSNKEFSAPCRGILSQLLRENHSWSGGTACIEHITGHRKEGRFGCETPSSTAKAHHPIPGSYRVYADSFRRSLAAENKSPHTIGAYLLAVGQLGKHLAAHGMPTDVDAISREHIESFITAILARRKPSTANQRYRSLQQFFNWLLEEGDITAHPMKNIKPPHFPEEPPAVPPENQLKRLLRAYEGKDFADRRDTAIIRLLLDTGMRRGNWSDLRSAMSTSTRTWRSCSARGARPAPARSARRPPAIWTATCGSVRSTQTRTCRTCGSVAVDQ